MPQSSVASDSVYGRRIVFFGAAEDVSEPTLLQLFSQHGDVTGLFVVRSALGLPCGCGYVTMADSEQAAAAFNALNGTSACAEQGSKLGLLVIQTCKQQQQQGLPDSVAVSPTSASNTPTAAEHKANNQQSPMTKDSRSVFFTKVPPTVTAHQLIQLFTACGEVLHLELFTPWPGAKISKGCGLVEFASPEAASAAVHSLHQAFTWPHSHSPLIVEWVDSNRQSANRANKVRSASAPGDNSAVRRTLTTIDGRKLNTASVSFMTPSQPSALYAAAVQQQQLMHMQQQQQQRSSYSCPLPQGSWAAGQSGLSAGTVPWMSPTATPYSNSSLLPCVAPPSSDGTGYRTPGSSSLDGSGFQPTSHLQQQQQQVRDSTTAQLLWQVQHGGSVPAGSSISGYETATGSSGLVGPVKRVAALSSTSSNLVALSPPAYSQQSLEASLQACTAGYSSDLSSDMNSFAMNSGLGGSPPTCPEPSLAVAGGIEPNSMDLAWQQLQQQKIMLLQPLNNPLEEPGNADRMLLPATTAALVEERQRRALQMNCNNPGSRTAYTNLLPVSSAIAGSPACMPQQPQQYSMCYQLAAPSPQVQQLLLQQQQQAQQRQMAAVQQQQQQHWWAQQQQQQVCNEEAAMVLVLSPRQLAAMPQVLQELTQMTGAKACLAGGSDGSVQLLLTGRLVEVQTAHSVAGMLLAKIGIEEPLLPAMPQRAC